jgi:hypothetical protein
VQIKELWRSVIGADHYEEACRFAQRPRPGHIQLRHGNTEFMLPHEVFRKWSEAALAILKNCITNEIERPDFRPAFRSDEVYTPSPRRSEGRRD